MTNTNYQEPPWATPPTDTSWALTEIKDGVSIAHHSLHRACTTIGRGAQHLVLAHESCSRMHARLAFDHQQTLWLRDLGSTHGTTVNKRKLPLEACGKYESDSTKPGARGVVVYPGDVLQFGASTRFYCIEGPYCCQRKPTLQTKQQQQQQTVNHHHRQEEEDATTTTQIIETKHRKQLEQIQALQYKLSNIQQESDRIRAKGQDLTKGQEQQLQRNQQRIQELLDKIQDKQQDLEEKLEEKVKPQHKKSVFELIVDDEVEDRTQQRHDDHELNPDGETEESLRTKWDSMQSELTQIVERVEWIQAKLEKQREEQDFFVQNEIQMDMEQKEKLVMKQQYLEGRLLEIEKLWKIVNPKIQLHAIKDQMHRRRNVNTNAVAPSNVVLDNAIPASVEEEAFMPPPPTGAPIVKAMPPPQFTISQAAEPSIPPPKFPTSQAAEPSMSPPQFTSSQAAEPSMPPPQFTTSQASELSAPAVLSRPDKRQRIQGPAMPPPSALLSQSKFDAVPIKATTKTVVNNEAADIWQPPKDQDGSGRSKLNDKFGGRY